jgi:myo-inositol-1(or 4)-monophosphatase
LPDVDLELLLDTVKQAGDIAMRFHGRSPRNWSKPDGTHVTEADIAVDDYLRTTIMTARPDDGWLSEETKDTPARLEKRRLWIADPIDGTRLFLAGEHGWGIGVALVIDGAPAMSALFCPSQKKFFHAYAGQGAFLNGLPLTRNANTTTKVIAPKSQINPLASAGLEWVTGTSTPLLLRFTAIAEGSLAGATTLGNKNDWDIAAGHLILSECGGITTNDRGGAIIYNRETPWQQGVVAGAAKWHKAILNCVGQH